MRLAVAGKGGAGKSVIAGTMARLLARRGDPVLAINGDFMPGLPGSLGVAQPSEPMLVQAVDNDGSRWRLKHGLGPVRAIRRFATVAPDGVRLLDVGDVLGKDPDLLFGSVAAFVQVVSRLDEPKTFRDWTIIADFHAGYRAVAYDWAPYARTVLVVVEPTRKSVLAGHHISRIVRSRPGRSALFVANRATDADARFVEDMLGEPTYARIPDDDLVRRADQAGVAPIDHAPSSPALLAIARMVDEMCDAMLTGN